MRYRFIEQYRAEHSIVLMCRVLQVSRSGYYAWRKRPESAREMANQELGAEIDQIFKAKRQVYGSPRIRKELLALGKRYSRKRIARLMRKLGLRARCRRKYKVTTQRNAAHEVAPNLLQQDFHAEHPNAKWIADITYIRTQGGWLYLAVILDLYSRRVIGWAMGPRLTQALALDALQMALKRCQPPTGLIHHSDQGSQYTSAAYLRLLKSWGIRVSMSSTGNCYDNAPAESFFGTLKNEWVHHQHYKTRSMAKTSIFDYIEVFYNRQRRHSSLDYVSPVDFELAYALKSSLSCCP